MKSKFVIIAIVVVLSLASLGAVLTTTGIGQSYSTTNTGTYADAQVDTVKWAREKGVVGASLSIQVTDSCNIRHIRVKRVVANKIVGNAVVVADTIAGAAVAGVVPASADSSADAASFVHTFTLTPYAEEYWFFVTYATGVTYKNAVDTNNVVYKIQKQYSQ